MVTLSLTTSHAAVSIPSERIDSRIWLVRGAKVILDSHLADLYEVELRILIQVVKRNVARFPCDFMFQINRQEFTYLKSQSVISSAGHGGRRSRPYVFTEQGVAMLSGLLNSPRAIAANIEIMRAFVRLRRMIASSADLARKLAALEKKYDAQFKAVFDAIRELMIPVEDSTPTHKREIGFHTLLRPARSRKT
jgi:hypothetical protein